jgi:oligosaccharide repeat unit polymerase
MNILLVTSILNISLAFIFYRKKKIQDIILSPSILTSLFMLTYCIIGFQLFWKGNYLFIQDDYELFVDKVYIVLSLFTFIFFFTELVIYSFIKIKKENIFPVYSVNFFSFINIYTFTVLISGIFLLKFSSGFLSGYFMFFFNSLIPIIGYYIIKSNKKFYLYLIIFTYLSIMAGFRFRLILTYFPLFFFFLKEIKTKSDFLKYIILFLIFVLIVTIVGNYRTYAAGVDFSRIDLSDFQSKLINGIFNDTSTVLVTGKFLHEFDENNYTYALLYQFKYVFELFLPKFLIEIKNHSPILDMIYDFTPKSAGAAVLGVGEYYHTGGILGVCFFAFLFSIYFTHLYKKQINLDNNFYKFKYLCLIFWLINTYTRGYFPQNFFELLTIIFGISLIRFSEHKHKYVIVKKNFNG